jgi:hypothetical protein
MKDDQCNQLIKLDVHGLLHTTPPKSLVGLSWLADRREGCLKVECNDRSLFYCLGKLQCGVVCASASTT